jgi:hypothetical protein
MTDPASKADKSRVEFFLRVKHPTIDPKEITERLELTPEYANMAGAAVSASGVKKLYSESYWLASIPIPSWKDLAAKVVHDADLPSRSILLRPKLPSMRLAHAAGTHDALMMMWLRTIETRSAFVKKIVDEGGSVTLVMQRADRNTPLSFGPALLRCLADLEIGIEID